MFRKCCAKYNYNFQQFELTQHNLRCVVKGKVPNPGNQTFFGHFWPKLPIQKVVTLPLSSLRSNNVCSNRNLEIKCFCGVCRTFTFCNFGQCRVIFHLQCSVIWRLRDTEKLELVITSADAFQSLDVVEKKKKSRQCSHIITTSWLLSCFRSLHKRLFVSCCDLYINLRHFFRGLHTIIHLRSSLESRNFRPWKQSFGLLKRNITQHWKCLCCIKF